MLCRSHNVIIIWISVKYVFLNAILEKEFSCLSAKAFFHYFDHVCMYIDEPLATSIFREVHVKKNEREKCHFKRYSGNY